MTRHRLAAPALLLALSAAPAPAQVSAAALAAHREAVAAQFAEFVHRLRSLDYPAAPAPSGAAPLRWDFSRAARYRYDYEAQIAQHGLGVTSSGTQRFGQNAASAGTLVVRARPAQRTAAIELRDTRITSRMWRGERSSTRSLELEPQQLEGYAEDGSLPPLSAHSRPPELRGLVAVLLRLPPAGLGPGERAELPVAVSSDVNGTPVILHGTARIALTRYVRVAGRTCAQLDAVLDLERMQPLGEIRGRGAVRQHGVSRLLFDVRAGAVVTAAVAAAMEFQLAGDSQDASGPPQLSMTISHFSRIDLAR